MGWPYWVFVNIDVERDFSVRFMIIEPTGNRQERNPKTSIEM